MENGGAFVDTKSSDRKASADHMQLAVDHGIVFPNATEAHNVENAVHGSCNGLDSGIQKPPTGQNGNSPNFLLSHAGDPESTRKSLFGNANDRRALWVRFKQGRPTEVDVEENDVHVDHLKKRLKTLFPRHLGHLEAFEFSLKLDSTDKECVPEDLPIDILRSANKAGSPVYIDTPEQAVSTPVRATGGSGSPFASPTAFLPSADGGPSQLLSSFQIAAPATSGDTSGLLIKSKSRAGTGSPAEVRRLSSHKKAADGLSKGHSVILLVNGEEVGRGRILSCERGGNCKLKLRSYSGSGSALTPDGVALRDIGMEEFMWPRADCKRDFRNMENE